MIDMAKYKLNLRDSLLLGEYFQSWSNLTLYSHFPFTATFF